MKKNLVKLLTSMLLAVIISISSITFASATGLDNFSEEPLPDLTVEVNSDLSYMEKTSGRNNPL